MNKSFFITSLLFLMLTLSLGLSAQTAQQIAFIDSDQILDAMPERVKATEKLTELNNSYKTELQSMQNEYNKKYSDFISYQTTMAENIRLRRMQELKELENSITDFMKIAQNDIDTQERDLLLPLRKKVKDAIQEVGIEQRLICIYDLSNPAIVFVTPEAMDISQLVKKKLGIK